MLVIIHTNDVRMIMLPLCNFRFRIYSRQSLKLLRSLYIYLHGADLQYFYQLTLYYFSQSVTYSNSAMFPIYILFRTLEMASTCKM